MHPTIYHEITKARIADLHHQAQSDALALAARRVRRARTDQSRDPVPARLLLAARRAFTALRLRSA